MMGEKQYLNDLEKNLKEQQVKERLEDVRTQYFQGGFERSYKGNKLNLTNVLRMKI